VDELLRSFYVDDLVSGASTNEQAYELYKRSKDILSEGEFTLRKWSSNSTELMEEIHKETDETIDIKVNIPIVEEDSSYANLMLGSPKEWVEAEQEQKVIGLVWDTKQDHIVFRFKGLIEAADGFSSTKRSVLRMIASIYAPIGFFSLIVI